MGSCLFTYRTTDWALHNISLLWKWWGTWMTKYLLENTALLLRKKWDTVCTILDSLLYEFYYIHWFYKYWYQILNIISKMWENQIKLVRLLLFNLVMKMLQIFLNKIHFKILLWIPSSEHWLFAFRLHYLMLLILPFLYNLFVFVFRVKLGGKLTSLLNCRFL